MKTDSHENGCVIASDERTDLCSNDNTRKLGWVAHALPLMAVMLFLGSFALLQTPMVFGDEQVDSAHDGEKAGEGVVVSTRLTAEEARKIYSQPSETWPAPHVDEGVEWKELGLLPEMPFPEDNPYTKEKDKLGEVLFFDPRLSGSRQIACASCHDSDLGWADGRTVSFGHERLQLKRNAPSAAFTGYLPKLFWDGRAESLEELSLQVIANPDEMHAAFPQIVERLKTSEDYRARFAEAFGDEEINGERIGKAIATFVRTIDGGNSLFDRFLRGNENALSDEALRGLHLFRTQGRCMNCHSGPVMSDGKLHNLGLSNYGRPFQDLGQYNITKKPEDVGKFRTPILRNVERTAPYMHNGLFELEVVLHLYNTGMFNIRPRKGQEDDPLFPVKSELLKPLDLSEADQEDIIAFLESLTEPPFRVRPPKLPEIPVDY